MEKQMTRVKDVTETDEQTILHPMPYGVMEITYTSSAYGLIAALVRGTTTKHPAA